MHDPDIERCLRDELRAEGIRWQDSYKRLSDQRRLELYTTMRLRREQKAAAEEAIRRKRAEPEPEDEVRQYDPEMAGAGNVNFSHGTGGGRRVIRSTRHLGG